MSRFKKKLFKLTNEGSDKPSEDSSDSTNKQKADTAPVSIKKEYKPKGAYYTFSENEEIVKYVTMDDKRFLNANSMSFWVEAENACVCPGRSAASLHERWRKLSVVVDQFHVDRKLAVQIKQYATASLMARRKMKDQILGTDTAVRGPPFERKEDKAILLFMQEDKTRDRLRNNLHLWGEAAKLNICPGRTPTSMMIRYRRLRTGGSRFKHKNQEAIENTSTEKTTKDTARPEEDTRSEADEDVDDILVVDTDRSSDSEESPQSTAPEIKKVTVSLKPLLPSAETRNLPLRDWLDDISKRRRRR